MVFEISSSSTRTGQSRVVLKITQCVHHSRIQIPRIWGDHKVLYEPPGGNQVDGLPPAPSPKVLKSNTGWPAS